MAVEKVKTYLKILLGDRTTVAATHKGKGDKPNKPQQTTNTQADKEYKAEVYEEMIRHGGPR